MKIEYEKEVEDEIISNNARPNPFQRSRNLKQIVLEWTHGVREREDSGRTYKGT